MGLITQKIQKAFDNAASSYDKYSHIQDVILRELCSTVVLESCDKRNILDVGCGTGNMSKFLNVANHNLIQVDLSREMCVLAKKKNNALSVNCHMDVMPFYENFFDVIIASMVLQWSRDVSISLLELFRVMKSDGILYVAIPIFGTLIELNNVIEKVGGSFSQFYKMNEFINIVNSFNVKVQYAFCCNYRQYHKSFRAFLLSMKLTGVYTKKVSDEQYNIFEISKIYKELYSLQNCIFNSWNIMYLVVKK
ncbi:ubiE/COQ5 methyltransferase family protein [Ehrlichia chaffeensis str. Heartland]|uniref:Biotin synthesis protein BioC n=1 Tax=Ehrlichia chaffeensis (strain ATCC CRL-10679 / Arkansas) TaxID=205920 RepID=Q2GI65_EHRCR|nr:methyltransferase domain-containing protein [Ehrlichia chaffeensis]ABD45055.1 putative biotin synthesis protein BioC [Ehrlichia chaffeensis str. Arkansas]AHX04147.1 ubiE/COQ5 methyltransferase family protein [Ehrlichia chaffeensis str. Heartland]AHX06082.1 ubiE/COQ5 methyltransferase family protein [Ehrlichia chaffeensis str. Jax]AHX07071.1 ubiE/COQ5 methyltransferase family protein [Ehrlichia chaffeensis str. Liberty]AHX07922.1 ubiE/COQ5 methyltransferase family protein [Ehrlichia chaffeen